VFGGLTGGVAYLLIFLLAVDPRLRLAEISSRGPESPRLERK
jgi:hypothetical protein